jgi:hypothetical protein
MYQQFLLAANSDAAMALCIAPGALQYGRRRMKSVANDSLVRSQTFPSSNFLKFVPTLWQSSAQPSPTNMTSSWKP